LNLDGPEHLDQPSLLAANAKDVVQNNGAAFPGDMEDHPAAPEQEVLEHVVNFVVNTEPMTEYRSRSLRIP
jgi:hypothetical protein